MLKDHLTIMIIIALRNRAIERVESGTLSLGSDPQEANAKSASTESPEKAPKRCGHESA